MKRVFCNPLNLSYKFQYVQKYNPVFANGQITGEEKDKMIVMREAADPSCVLFKDKYYLFPSMSKGFWVSDDLAAWRYVPLVNTPHYDYAPDVRVKDDYLYFCASSNSGPCTFYRTKDPESGIFEEISTSFAFWDPNVFFDDDKKTYFYWGCSNKTPIYGVELNAEMIKKCEAVPLIASNVSEHGFERSGENHVKKPLPDDASEFEKALEKHFGDAPFIEGAWMTKNNGKYYLQYAAPGTEYNIYADGVYVSDHPLSGFTYAENNPYSYKPTGFICGAGHGSTLKDKYGNYWHFSTMGISRAHNYERRLGLFPAGFDKDGELFCNQRYADWVTEIPDGKFDPWTEPSCFLLSYNKPVRASSYAEGYPPEFAVDENIKTWWKAKGEKDEWLEVDLKDCADVSYVQINFADDLHMTEFPQGAQPIHKNFEDRYIDDTPRRIEWILEASADDKNYFTVCDKAHTDTDLPHDLAEVGKKVRYLRCKVLHMPHGENAAVSGLRVFGKSAGALPKQAENVRFQWMGDLDADVAWTGNAMGHNVLWGHAPDKLYHSALIYGKEQYRISAVNRGQALYVRIDSFNGCGITHGKVVEVKYGGN